MILSDQTISKYIKENKIKVISEYGQDDILENVGCASLDIRLGNTFLCFPHSDQILDAYSSPNFEFEKKYIQDNDFLLLQPGDFVLGATKEKFGIPDNIVARVEGRSSIGRLGILVHVTAGFIDPGFGRDDPSTITLEIKNINTVPVKLKIGSRISQLAFEIMDQSAVVPYNTKKSAKYNGQQSPESSRIYKDPSHNLD